MDSTSKYTPCAEHSFTTLLRSTWETVDALRYQVLSHSREVAMCSKCGAIADPLDNQKEN